MDRYSHAVAALLAHEKLVYSCLDIHITAVSYCQYYRNHFPVIFEDVQLQIQNMTYIGHYIIMGLTTQHSYIAMLCLYPHGYQASLQCSATS